MKRIFALPLLVLILPVYVRDKVREQRGAFPAAGDRIEQLHVVSDYINVIQGRGQSPDDQGALIETLDSEQPLDAHNADVSFNPASVMKLATSLMALDKFGPDYRYRTNILADGSIDSRSRTLNGDLVVEGAADPMFSQYDAAEIASELSRIGVTRVSGALRIAGPFYYFANGYRSNLSPETSAAKLRAAFQKAGVRIEGHTVFGEKSGTMLLSHYSDPLVSILLFQNAHSSNAVAEVVGASLGGPEAIQNYLTAKLNLTDGELFVGRASGLDFNRITPRTALKVVRALVQVLADHSLKPEDVMAVAGVDSGTLRSRLFRDDLRGSVIAKTGTLNSLDKGVSTLVGIAYTRAHGPVLFALFNTGGSVRAFRRLQDQFVEKMINEFGGPLMSVRHEDALADVTRHSIVQVQYGSGYAECATE